MSFVRRVGWSYSRTWHLQRDIPRLYSVTLPCRTGEVTDGKDNFLPHNHPVIVRHNDTNTFYLHPDLVLNDRELTFAPNVEKLNNHLSAHSIRFSAVESPARKHLRSQSYELKKMMFFYSETNPHSGLIGNAKQLLYDFFQLIGPVKDSWFRILMHDTELCEVLITHVKTELESTGDMSHSTGQAPSIATIASMLDRLAAKKGVSNCKYKSVVADNLFQIQRNNLTGAERALIEVLAQYAYIEYEVIDH